MTNQCRIRTILSPSGYRYAPILATDADSQLITHLFKSKYTSQPPRETILTTRHVIQSFKHVIQSFKLDTIPDNR